MRLIHKLPFTAQEIEGYRQLVFSNVILGLKALIDAMDEFDIEVSDENKVRKSHLHGPLIPLPLQPSTTPFRNAYVKKDRA